jgi:hypothetical protein
MGPPMELFAVEDVTWLTNPGVVSEQLLWPDNSGSQRLTITRSRFRLSIFP